MKIELQILSCPLSANPAPSTVELQGLGSLNVYLDFDSLTPEQKEQLTGPQGDAATVEVGTVTTGAAGSPASVENVGTPGAAVFNFTIPAGEDGREVQLQANETHLQYKLEGEVSWIDIIALSLLKGADGSPVEIRVDGGYIQYKLVSGLTWTNIIATSSLVGERGPACEFQSTATHLQYRAIGTATWIDLVALSVITGPQGGSTLNTPITRISPGTFNIDQQAAEDFTFTCGTAQTFTVSNIVQGKPTRLFLTGGTLPASPITGYTNVWASGQSEALYDPTKTNWLWVEIIGTTAFISILNQYE